MDDGVATIEGNGITTRYFDCGAGEQIVLLHGGEFGGSSSGDTWRPELHARLAAARHRVIAIDRLGQGGTGNPASPDDYLVSRVVEHVCDTLDLLGYTNATIAGQSRGAFVAGRIAIQRPDLVLQLVLFNSGSLAPGVDAQPRQGDRTYEIYVERWTDDLRTNMDLLSVTTEHITQDSIDVTDAFHQSPERARTREVFATRTAEYFAEYQELKDQALACLQSPEFTKPTMLIWSVGDPTLTLDDGEALYRTFAEHSEFLRRHVINNAGHAVYREYYEKVASLMVDFIARTTR